MITPSFAFQVQAARLIFAADTEDGIHFLELHVVLVGSLPVGAHGVWLLTCDVKKSGNEVIRVLVDIYEVCEAFRSQGQTTWSTRKSTKVKCSQRYQ